MSKGIPFVVLFFSSPCSHSLSTTSEEHYYPIPAEEETKRFQSFSSDSSAHPFSEEELHDVAIFPYADFLTTTSPPLSPKLPNLQEWSPIDNIFPIFPYASFLTTSTTQQPKRKMSSEVGTERKPGAMKPTNVIHFLEKILKMKRQSAETLKTGNRNKSRPNQVRGAENYFKDKKKKPIISEVVKKEDFTKSEALQKLFDIAGDDWGLNKEDPTESFNCPKVSETDFNVWRQMFF